MKTATLSFDPDVFDVQVRRALKRVVSELNSRKLIATIHKLSFSDGTAIFEVSGRVNYNRAADYTDADSFAEAEAAAIEGVCDSEDLPFMYCFAGLYADAPHTFEAYHMGRVS